MVDLFAWLRPLRREPVVMLISKDECPLCDEALESLRLVGGRIPHRLEIVKIEDDADLERRHGLEVPVLFIDGVKRFFGKVDGRSLQRALLHAARGQGATASPEA